MMGLTARAAPGAGQLASAGSTPAVSHSRHLVCPVFRLACHDHEGFAAHTMLYLRDRQSLRDHAAASPWAARIRHPAARTDINDHLT